MIDINPNQPLYDPLYPFMPPQFAGGNDMFMNQPRGTSPMISQKKPRSSPLSRIPSLHLPAIILLAVAWLLHTIATFIPYWSTYSGISGSRAGLWSARYFNYLTIQNFYFPQPTDFPTLTNSIRFTNANTKGYLVTVQFLMTFNFVFILIVLILLTLDYVFSQRNPDRLWSLVIRDYNTSDTAIKYGLLLYILYVFVIFEFAAWITYVGSRHDNNWNMHVSFAFAVIVSVFLVVVFVMYVIEFFKRFQKNRLKWDYWYGPYIEWGFFVYLSALLLLLIVICCPEWAYSKNDLLYIFPEIGLFKQCYLSSIYKKSATTGYCTLSNSSSNQSWVNAAQAFVLMAYIIGIILLIVIVYFRKEFRHNAGGYVVQRVTQPKFTFMIAGLILFFCFIFSLIGISIFGGKVFPHSLTVNWAYILAVFAMVLFLVTGILFILDAVHSGRQKAPTGSSASKSFFFPAPLNQRVLAMQPLLKPEPAWQPPASPAPFPQLIPQQQPWQTFMPPFDFQQQQQPAMYPIENYGMEQYPFAPITQAAAVNYFRQMLDNPQLPPLPFNQGLMNYAGDNSLMAPDNRNNMSTDDHFNHMARRQLVQQQRLNYNHERLLEKYSRLRTPRVAEFRAFGSSSLPGRNYDEYLDRMRGNRQESSLAGQSRAGIGTSNETYRWMGDGSLGPLPRDVSTVLQHSRDESMPFVQAEKFEPVKMYYHPVFGPTPAYIRPLFKKPKQTKKDNDKSKNKVKSDDSDHEEEIKTPTTVTTDDDDNEISDHTPLGYISYKNWKTKHEHLVPVNPLLFKIYTQRSNGSIQSYGHSLYVPSGHHSRDNRLNHYEGISTSPPSKLGSILTDIPRETTSSSKHRYNKLHSQPTSTSVSQRPRKSFSSGNNKNSVDKESKRPASSTPHQSRNNSNLKIIPSSSSIPVTSSIAPLNSIGTSATGTSIVNNAGKPSLSSSNVPDTSNISPIPPKPESISTSSSTAAYQTLSNFADNPSTIIPLSKSKTTSSYQEKYVSMDSTANNVVSSSSSSDSDDDDAQKKRGQQEKK